MPLRKLYMTIHICLLYHLEATKYPRKEYVNFCKRCIQTYRYQPLSFLTNGRKTYQLTKKKQYRPLDDTDAYNIAKLCEINWTLRNVYVPWNKITNEGMVYLTKAVQKNPNLSVLDVRGNQIQDNGFYELIHVLHNRTTPIQILFDQNDLTVKTQFELLTALETNAINSSIKYLHTDAPPPLLARL